VGKMSIKDTVLSKDKMGNFKILNVTEGKTDYIDVICICGRKVSINLYGLYRGETNPADVLKGLVIFLRVITFQAVNGEVIQ